MRLIQWQVHAEGGVEVVYAGASPQDRLWVGDGRGLEVEVAPAVEVFGQALVADLIGASDDGSASWRAEDGGGWVDLGLDPDDASPEQLWRMQATRSGLAASFAFVDPLAGEATPLQAGFRYRLGLRVEGAPAGGTLQLQFLGAPGPSTVLTRRLEDSAEDGGQINLDFEAPAGVQGVRLSLTCAGPQPLLAGRPWLQLLGASDVRPLLFRLRRRGVARMRECPADAVVARLRAPIPAHLLDGDEHSLLLAVRGPQGGSIEQPAAFRFAPSVEVTRKGVERASVVRLVGRLHETALRYVRLQLCIDGRPGPVEVLKANTAGRFDARLPIPPEHLDGRPHLIEARLADSQAVLFATNERAAAFHTRWPVLQLWAQPPLSPESSPAAGRHLKALSAWAVRAHQGESVPDVAALQDELLAGVRQRTRYPPLAFAQVEAPAISVIMPAHNKFEITYAGLCALRFAPVQVAFEVIVVDDGSTDATADLERVVAGVRVVRHAQGQGFVAACNDGAAQARGRYVCFLNNDTEVTAGWLDALLRPFADDPATGLTGAKLIYPDGRLQEAGGIVWGTGDPWNAGRGGDADAPAWNYRRQADYLSGAAILTSAQVWRELGGFGEEWAPAYFEDTDFAMKVRASGRRVVYAPDAEVYHFEGQTAGVDKTQGVKLHQELNRPKFKAKWRELYAGHGQVVGERPDLEKDRGVVRRVLMLVPHLGFDAERAQAIARLQAEGCKVTLWPLDLAWRSDVAKWGGCGVETLFAPFAAELPPAVLASDLDLVISTVGAAAGPLRLAMLGAKPGLEWLDALHLSAAGERAES